MLQSKVISYLSRKVISLTSKKAEYLHSVYVSREPASVRFISSDRLPTSEDTIFPLAPPRGINSHPKTFQKSVNSITSLPSGAFSFSL